MPRLKGSIMGFKHLTRLPLAFAAFALPAQAIAAEQCLTPVEAQSMMNAFMPDLLDGVIKQCAPSVPKAGFFAKSGEALVARYRAVGDKSWPAAKKVFLKMAGGDKSMTTLSALPDDMIKALVSVGISTSIAGDIKPQDCGAVERIVEALSPLPPENTSTLVGVFIEMDANKKGKGKAKSGFDICPSTPPLLAQPTASK